MPSKLSLHLLSAVMLAAALLLCASAPLEDASTDSMSGDFSGEEDKEVRDTSCLPRTEDILKMWENIIELPKNHKKEFEEEFSSIVDYRSLETYKQPSFPLHPLRSNFSREACFQNLTEGLLIYTVLLRHTEKEYPNNLILPKIRAGILQLIALIKGRMKNGEAVTALTSSQEENLLKELDSPDTFKRKMTAHSVLYFLRPFLIDGLRSFRKWQPSTVMGTNCHKGQKDVKAG